MKLLLINQFGPESGAPTGRILGELGRELEQRGHTVHLLTTNAPYGKPRRGLKRIFQEAWAHLSLGCRSLGYAKVDAVLSLTSPACLAVTAAIVAKIQRARHFHWVMDLYPEVGVRLGELKDGPLADFLGSLTHRAYRGASRVVVLDEDMRNHLQDTCGVDSAVIGPFPPDITWPSADNIPRATRRWLYSGNFGRAHEIEILLQVQKRLEESQVEAELILQGDGPQFLSSRDAAKRLGLRRVQWRDPVPMAKLGESLTQSDVLVVTRREDMKGLLLPSKLLLAELSGKRVLWIGDTDGKTAQRLAQTGRHGVFAVGDVEPIASWLQTLFQADATDQSIAPTDPGTVRGQMMDRWEALLTP